MAYLPPGNRGDEPLAEVARDAQILQVGQDGAMDQGAILAPWRRSGRRCRLG
jgi:hypothetical protein